MSVWVCVFHWNLTDDLRYDVLPGEVKGHYLSSVQMTRSCSSTAAVPLRGVSMRLLSYTPYVGVSCACECVCHKVVCWMRKCIQLTSVCMFACSRIRRYHSILYFLAP